MKHLSAFFRPVTNALSAWSVGLHSFFSHLLISAGSLPQRNVSVTSASAAIVGTPSRRRRGLMLKPLALMLLFLLAGVGQVWGEEEVYKTALFAAANNSTGNSSYSGTFTATNDGFTVSVANFNNNNNGWSGTIKCGSKNNTSVASISTSAAIDKAVTKVVVTIANVTANSVNSIKLYRSTNGSSWTEESSFTVATGAQEAAVASANQAANLYYKVEFDCKKGSGNGFVGVSKVEYYVEKDESAPTLESIAIGGDLSNKSYEEGQELDFSGLTVTGTYSDSNTDDVTGDVEWSFTPALAVGTTSYTVTATIGEISDSKVITGVNVTEHVVTPGEYTINLTNTLFGTAVNTNITSAINASQNDISLVVNGTGSTKPRTDATYIRFYGSSSLRLSVPEGYNITKIVISANQSDYSAPSVSVGEFNTSTKTWAGKSNEVLWSFSGKSFIGQIKVTYEAIAPEVTVDESLLEFAAKQNIAVAGKTFTLEGANLSSGLTLAASEGFTVSPTSLTAEAAMADGGAEVTVTPATPTATTTPVEGMVTISGGGLKDNVVVNLSMTVTPTYLVAIAVNDDDMGSATINGGTASIYVTDDEEIALVATPAEHHEFVNWTVSDENIVLDNANNATTTAIAGAAGTITANFKVQACTGLAAPVLDDVTTTYQSATIAWEAVANADGYVLNIKKHEGNVPVVTDELITSGVSFEKTGLDANTQYDYTVMAVGDGTDYCDESNPLLESNFTTEDYPAATLTLSENGEEHAYAGSHKLNDVVTLPSELEGAGCKNKVLVGWSSVAVSETDVEPTSNYWAKGADYTIASTADVLYAVLATVSGGGWSKVEIASISEEDVIVVAGVQDGENYYGLSSAKGTSSSPSAIALTVSENVITDGVVDAVKWNLKGTANNYILYANGTDNYLYNTAATTSTSGTNTAWRVGQPTEGTIRKLLKVNGTTLSTNEASNVRYLCQYNNADWRGYVNNTSNNAKTTIAFFKQNTSTTAYTTSCTAANPKVATPVISGIENNETYTTSKTVTLTCGTEGAAIYYSLDGADAVAYTEAFSVDTYGAHTITAYATKADYDDSDEASVSFTLNLPFTSVSDLFAYLNANSLTSLSDVTVSGVVTEIVTEYSSTNKNISFNIADDFDANSAQLQGFRTKNGTATAVTEADAAANLAVGDRVTLKGNYTYYNSTTHELAANNTIEAYTAKVLSSVTISGTASKTAYSAEDNVFSFAGLTATAAYSNTGYSADVTADATWKAAGEASYEVAASGDVNVTATYGGQTSDPVVVAVTFTTKTIASISLSYNSTYTFVGFDLPTPTVTASYVEDIADEDITDLVAAANGFDTESAYKKDVADTYTIKVAYAEQEAEYTVEVRAKYNNEDAPHTVADATAIIDHEGSSSESDYMWVRGIVVGFNGNYNNRYYISDDGTTTGQLYVFNGKTFSGEAMTADNKPAAGDVVILKTKMQIFNSVNELSSSQVVYQLQNALPNIAIADVAELEVDQDDLDMTELITKDGNGVVTLVSGNNDKLTVNGLVLHAVAAGDVTVTANLAATANNGSVNYKANSTTFNVHVIATRPRYTVTFANGGATGGSAPEAIANQLENAKVYLPTNTYSWANHGFDGWAVATASDNVTIDEDENGKYFLMPAANVTITATWEELATTHIIFNTGGVTNEVAAVDIPQGETAYTDFPEADDKNGYEFVGWAENVLEETETAPTLVTTYTPNTDAEKTFYAIYSRLDDSDPNYGKYEKATAVAEGDYLIVCENQNVAMDGSLSTLDAAGNNKAVTISDGVLTLENADNYVFTIAAVTDGYSIKSKSGYYVGGKGSESNGMNSSTSTEYTNTISISNGDAEIIGNGAYMRCNPNSNNQWFRYFKASTYTGQKAIQLYKKNLGTTYYTSSPVEKVTITFNANGGEGGCEKAVINKGSQLTICAEEPTKTHSEFTGWKNGSDVYEAGQAYTFDADITLTAQWTPAATYTVTYAANGATAGNAPTDATEYYAGDDVTVLGKGDLEKDDYDFQGWKYDGKLYAAGASFTMPASAVEFVAQWKKQNISTETMTLVTSESLLSDGMQVVLGYQGESEAKIAGEITGNNNKKEYFSAQEATISDNQISIENAVIMTLHKVANGWLLSKDESNYLTISSNNINWDAKENAAIWTITISNSNATIKNGDNWIQYNSSNPRFKTYSSTQKSIMLFGKSLAITNNASISELGYVEGDVIIVNENKTLTMDVASAPASIIVKDGATVTISAEETKVDNLTVENGGKVAGSNQLIVLNDLTIEATAGSSGQVMDATKVNAANIYIDVNFYKSAASLDATTANQWYMISAPFDVNLNEGFFQTDGTPMVFGTDFDLFEYDGSKRASTGVTGWKRAQGKMLAGVAYLVGFNVGQATTIRLKAASTNMTEVDRIGLNTYTGVDEANSNWNGVANPTLHYISLDKDVQYYDNDARCYNPGTDDGTSYVVGTAFFIHGAGEANISSDVNATLKAPRRANDIQMIECGVTFAKESATWANRIYVRASENASTNYEAGHDLQTLNGTTSNNALLWLENYGMRLAIEEAPMADNIYYALTLSVSTTGTYILHQVKPVEGAELYVTYEGAVVWNLSESDYILDMTKGQYSSYGLKMVITPRQLVTGVDEVEKGHDGTFKFIEHDMLFIRHNDALYNANGQKIK